MGNRNHHYPNQRKLGSHDHLMGTTHDMDCRQQPSPKSRSLRNLL